MISGSLSGVMSSSLPQILARSRNGKIHSLFSQSFNIGFEQGLVHIRRAGGQLSSFGMRISDSQMDDILPSLETGDLVKTNGVTLTIYPTYGPIVQIETARLQSIDLSLHPVETAPRRLAILRQALEAVNAAASLGLTLTEQDWVHLNALTQEDVHSEAFQAAARYLVGRGKGLTPSGDDILLGFFLALKLFGQASGLTQPLLDFIERSTTSISAAYLRDLANGYISEYFQMFCQATALEDPDRLRSAIEQITTIGSTSGYDSLMGMSLGVTKLEGRSKASFVSKRLFFNPTFFKQCLEE
ncbi:MAG: DUF2877 domain-containing protein [Chloroflexi bacterium]|jgi:Protein of unknown function (DUF2877).|nr:DUF2877 domain-containing protein [Chloroflexota bacterium]NOG76601.1 DUF2877 domain-containing protein [Chloroflexota bacterium]WKZ55372.1 MAG: DUF2877 domain-containing protein [Anaerolineales bacterium]GIK08712.1 MAG: hypothetical protein BroJett001_07780 [Chloroflexota bacterium]